MRQRMVLVPLILLATLAACGKSGSSATTTTTSAGSSAPQAAKTYTDKDNGSTTTVATGQNIRVELSSNPGSTGYQWKLGPLDTKVLSQVSDQFVPPSSSQQIGTPGTQVYVFRAVGPGTTTITAGDNPPGSTQPTQTFKLNVTVSG